MYGWMAALLVLGVIIGALGNLLGTVSLLTTLLLFSAFPLLFLIAFVAMALREPPRPTRRLEAARLERLSRQRF